MNLRSFQLPVLAIIGAVAIRLYATDQLGRYIHPSTNWLVLTAGVLVVAISSWLFLQERRNEHGHATTFQLLSCTCVAAVLAVSQPSSLSSNLAKQREAGAVPVASNSSPSYRGLSQNFTVLEWLSAWEADPTQKKYIGRKASVSGFLTREGDRYFINRFLVTCCIVDAQPLRMELLPTHSFAISEGAWLEVRGSITERDRLPAIAITEIAEVPAPEDQYVY
jgi:uncharacterized repeat protein (TIGR03943 family)